MTEKRECYEDDSSAETSVEQSGQEQRSQRFRMTGEPSAGSEPPPVKPERAARPFVPQGFPGDMLEIDVDMPPCWDTEVMTGSEGDRAFIEFSSSLRRVRVRFPRKMALDVAKGMVGLVSVASMHAANEYLSEVLQEPEKLTELLAVLPAALGALSKTAGPAGRGAAKLLKSLGLIERYRDIMEREAAGAESQEEGPQERPADPGPAPCPKCGRPGRPTGRAVDGEAVYVCDNKECKIGEFVITRER